MITERFKRSSLWRREEEVLLALLRNSVSTSITDVGIERRFVIETSAPLDEDGMAILEWVLKEAFEPGQFGSESLLSGDVFEVGPRIEIVTPSSTNAVSICHACGLGQVTRIEQMRRIKVVLCEGDELSDDETGRLKEMLFDRMTERAYDNPIMTFESSVSPGPVSTIPIMEKGMATLEEANGRDGLDLGLSHLMLEYIFAYFHNELRRNPTDVELFMFGQLNSEHCRHHLFNAVFVIDGREMPASLFKMIRATTEANPGNIEVAYSDNAAVTTSKPVLQFLPKDPTGPAPFVTVLVETCECFKVETHNHPTTIEAYAGSGTGLGGDIRDIQGVGRGATVTGALACYNIGSPFIPGYPLPWERVLARHQQRFRIPLEIIIQASDGASDYGNKFGVPLTVGSCRTFDQIVGDTHYGWSKTAMVAGNWGICRKEHARKLDPEQGFIIVQIGGDGYPIGLGGGSGSSKNAGGQSEELDFDSVQRANPEMENRTESVIRACCELGDATPIVTLTDLGAGGECVALPEIVEKCGAHYGLREIPCGDRTMTVLVLWCNESQERMVIIIWPERLKALEDICSRNRCPMHVVGEVTGDGRLVVTDSKVPGSAPREQREPISVDMGFLLADLPTRQVECTSRRRELEPLNLPGDLTVSDALERVLRLMHVGSRHFLTRKVDRSVGGLVARQQTVGPHQLTVADCSVTAHSFFGKSGTVTSIGEQPIKGIISSPAGSRMSIGECLTNMAGARVAGGMDVINLSATWQWPCGQPGEDARLYEAVEAASELCRRTGLRIPVGKDSVSMTAMTEDLQGGEHRILAPGTVQMVGFAPTDDVKMVATPDIKSPGSSHLMLIDLSGGNRRLGGSALAQVYEQVGNEVPDVDKPELLVNGFMAVQELLDKGLVMSYHDISEGGLMTCLLEMAFAGNCGLDISLVQDFFLGFHTMNVLFAEELGLVIEVENPGAKGVLEVLKKHGLEVGTHVFELGTTIREGYIFVHHGEHMALSADMRYLRDVWQETSFRLDALQANPDCVERERREAYARPGMKFSLLRGFRPSPTPGNLMESSEKPRVAILREEGTNGAREMAGAFHSAGFEVVDVHMTDLAEGRISLSGFRGMAFCGGFSFADVMGAGKGWAAVAKYNESISAEFAAFRSRPDTFSLGVCNGCQVMALLGWVPWTDVDTTEQPMFVGNESGIFESRFVSVKILESPSIFLRGMEGSVLGVWVAHAEGRCMWPNEDLMQRALDSNLAPVRFVDDRARVTNQYPFNPNGSEQGITGICSPDGRHLAMMPHPERLFLKWQWPWMPAEWEGLEVSPWLRLFQNARKWCDNITETDVRS